MSSASDRVVVKNDPEIYGAQDKGSHTTGPINLHEKVPEVS